MIQPGDKVMVVYSGCACVTSLIGLVSTVRCVVVQPLMCRHCWNILSEQATAEISIEGNWGFLPVTWLRKMPPDGSGVDVDEDLTLEVH